VAVVFDDVHRVPTVFGNVVEDDPFGVVFGHRLRATHALPSSCILQSAAIKERSAENIEGRKAWEGREMPSPVVRMSPQGV
jgi:hypothetical protein